VRFLFAVLAASVIALAGCGEPSTVERSPHTLFVRGGGSIQVFDAQGGGGSFEVGRGVPSPNWSTVVHTDTVVGGTRVVASDPTDGGVLWSATVGGSVEAKVVSADGSVAALSPKRERLYSYGRRSTELVIARADGVEPQRLTLDGNYEPEAFASSGDSLFVIRYVPALRPTRYQVRQLDLTTGEVGGVYTPHGELQQTMGGTARIQASSSDGKRLYTLYTVGHDATQPAFVHVLDLEQKWAHCVDLPAGFGRRAEEAATLTVSPDGKTLYAANASSNALASIDTETFRVTSEGEGDLVRGRSHAVADSAGTLYIAGDHYVTAYRGSDFTRKWRVSIPKRARGLQVAGDRLYVGLPSQVASFDVATGAAEGTVDPPGLDKVRQLGPVLEFEEPQDAPIKCAC
jgi:DNA-binding beta-propeller fold protein YncE